ncbi:MAG: HAMP domain-containing histidine kinase [Deltaproteobacteria bacterium]|nr:HAMP domain-containing histidine kinase [Deltaproteobacteria bacterium]
MKKEVSCRALNILFVFLKEKDIDLNEFLKDMPYSIDYFLDQNNWIDYETLLKIYEKIRKHFPEPDVFVEIGREIVNTKAFGFISIMIHLLASPRAIYKQFPYYVNSMFRCVQCEVVNNSPNKVTLGYTFKPDYEPSQAFFDIARGVIEKTSAHMGVKSATVVPVKKGPSCHFIISWNLRIPWYQRLWYQFVIRPKTHLHAIEELRKNHRMLEEKYDEVSQLNDDLKNKIKELEETQIQLIQSEKMGAIGELTSGIIHEVKSPLGVIEGYSEMLHEILENRNLYKGELREFLEGIDKGCNSISKITEHLRNFSYSKPVFVETEIEEIIENAVLLFEPKAKKASIRITKNLQSDIHSIMAEPNQLEQVLLNLLNNAKDAVSHSETPHIQLSSRLLNHHIEIEVRDNGEGIAPDIQKKIFEPFFTTKPRGTGTGLGLAICKKIIESHSGTIRANSKPSEGTSFIISLPLKQEQKGASFLRT